MKIQIILIILLAAIISNAQVQFETDVSGAGTNAASFLEIGVGARASAMGGSYAAVSNDPTSLFYNPAGAVWVNGIQIEVQHNEWLVDSKYDFVGIVAPVSTLSAAVGISVITLGYGNEQPVRTVERPEGTGEFWDARDLAVGLTYSMALTDRFSFGLTGKYINQRIWKESGTALAVDVGIFYNTIWEGIRIGFSISNFGSDLQLTGPNLTTTVDPDPNNEGVSRTPAEYKTEAYPLPLLFRFGISYQKDLGRLGSILATVDLNHPSHTNESVSLGGEYGFGGSFFIRAGYENLFDEEAISGMSLGGGVDYFFEGAGVGARFDYAWTNWGPFDGAQRFSLGIVF